MILFFFVRSWEKNSQNLFNNEPQFTSELVVAEEVHQHPPGIKQQPQSVSHLIYDNQTEEKMQG